MRSRTLGAAVAVLGALVVASPAQAAPKTTEVLQQFVVSGKGADPEALARAGYDMTRGAARQEGRLPDHRHAVAGGEARGEGRLGPAARRQADEREGRSAEPAAGPDARIRRLPAVEPRTRRRARPSARLRCCRCASGTCSRRARTPTSSSGCRTASRASASSSRPSASPRAPRSTAAGLEAGRALQRDPARPRVDRDGDQPAAVQVRARAQERRGLRASRRSSRRPSCGSSPS